MSQFTTAGSTIKWYLTFRRNRHDLHLKEQTARVEYCDDFIIIQCIFSVHAHMRVN